MITTLLILLIAFQLKHFVADFPLQTKYMLGKFKDEGWVRPLLAHVAVHGVMTFVIAFHFTTPKRAFLLGVCDAYSHFCMDRIKASPKLLGRFKSLTAETAATATPEQWHSNNWFWYSMGIDQMWHHLTHYAIIWYLVTHVGL